MFIPTPADFLGGGMALASEERLRFGEQRVATDLRSFESGTIPLRGERGRLARRFRRLAENISAAPKNTNW
jgi:hypothetical protein